jgi:hypothetical protein
VLQLEFERSRVPAKGRAFFNDKKRNFLMIKRTFFNDKRDI